MRMKFLPSTGSLLPLLAVARENAADPNRRPKAVVWLGPQSPFLRRQNRLQMPPAILAYLAALMALGLTAIVLHPAESETQSRTGPAPAKFADSLPGAPDRPRSTPAPQAAVAVADLKTQPSEPASTKEASKVASREASLGWLLVPEPMIPLNWPFASGPGSPRSEAPAATAALPQRPPAEDQAQPLGAEPAAIKADPDEPGEAAPDSSRARQGDERPVRSIRHQQAERMVADRTTPRASPQPVPTPPPPPPPTENYWKMIR
jgi:hypothetical protein